MKEDSALLSRRYIITRPRRRADSGGPSTNDGHLPPVPCGTFADRERAIAKARALAEQYGEATMRIVAEETITFTKE